MQLQAVPTFDAIDPLVFHNQFYEPQKPVVLKNLAKKMASLFQMELEFF